MVLGDKLSPQLAQLGDKFIVFQGAAARRGKRITGGRFESVMGECGIVNLQVLHGC
jgi:hypothetical protein